jgi:cytochrome P450
LHRYESITAFALHIHSPLTPLNRYWEAPNTFTPTRFLKAFKNPEEAPSWKGFDPALWKGQLYPNEIAADYAYIPFGAGPRK